MNIESMELGYLPHADDREYLFRRYTLVRSGQLGQACVIVSTLGSRLPVGARAMAEMSPGVTHQTTVHAALQDDDCYWMPVLVPPIILRGPSSVASLGSHDCGTNHRAWRNHEAAVAEMMARMRAGEDWGEAS